MIRDWDWKRRWRGIDPSPRQMEIMEQVIRGRTSYREISAAMDISENTIRTHLSNLYAKLNVHNMTEAVYVLASRGLLDLWSG